MNKINRTIESIKKRLSPAEASILWLTGTAESLLLLNLILQVKNVPVLIFPEFWNKQQKEFIGDIIKTHNLTAYFFRPAEAEIVGENLVSRYETDKVDFNLAQRIVKDGKICGFDKLRAFAAEPKLAPAYLWDRTFLTGDIEILRTETTLVFALSDWSESAKREAYKHLDLPESDVAAYYACLNCFEDKEVIFCPQLGMEI